jgi:hypothetical protein
MTSPIDVCNRALSTIGARAAITSFNQPNPASVNCGLWYDKLRRQLLRAAPWGFARRQVSLTQTGDLLPDMTSPYPWRFKYAYPSDCLKLRYILPPMLPVNNTVAPSVGLPIAGPWGMNPPRRSPFIVINDYDPVLNPAGSKALVCNIFQAIAVYNGDITDPDQWDDLFEGALTAALAYHLCMPLSGNIGLMKEWQSQTMSAIAEARAADGNEAQPSSDVKVDWMETRGVGPIYALFGPFASGAVGGALFGEAWSTMTWGA